MTESPFSLEGKVVLVTGASSGIGRQTAVECARAGASVILVGRNEERLRETEAAIGCGVAGVFILDLTVPAAVSETVAAFPKLDGIVSNAGTVKSELLKFSEREETEEMFRINVFSHIDLVRELVRQKKMNKGASVVFTSSIVGLYCGMAGQTAYGSSKAALAGFAKSLAIELAPRGIRVNTVHPGMIVTPMLDKLILSQEEYEKDLVNYPLGRYGRPEDVAYSVVFLLSDATAWMTGSQLLIDGGHSLK